MVIVDGIRVSSDQAPPNIPSAVQPSRLDDFAPEEIERVNVLRGPAAAALYGPGAGAGVIVITTERGHRGPFRWMARAEDGVSTKRVDFPSNYQMAGISTTTGQPMVCSLLRRVEQRCTPTTLSVWNPLEQASPFRVGRSSAAGVTVSGSIGSTAPLGLRIGGMARRELGVTSDDDERRFQVHSAATRTLSLPLVGHLDLDLSTTYIRRDMSLPAVGNSHGAYNPIAAGLLGRAVDDSVHGYSTSSYRVPSRSAGDVDHFIGTIGTHWSPLPWFEGALVIGRDRAAQRELRLTTHSSGSAMIEAQDIARTHHELTSMSVMSAATWALGPLLRGRSVAALEREWSRDSTYQAALFNDPSFPLPSGTSLWQWSDVSLHDIWLRQELAWSDRLFVNGALRWDRRWNEYDGRKSRTPYPSVDLSWRVSPTVAGGAEVRLRGAYGRTGSAARPLPLLLFFTQPIGTPPSSTALKPESMSEYEAGFDASFHHGAQLALTFYRRQVDNLFVPAPANTYGYPAQPFYNGSMHTSGIEALARADLVRTTHYSWDAAFTFGTASNRVDDLGQSEVWQYDGTSGPNVVMRGHPYGGYYGFSYSFTDANNNRQVDSAEVQRVVPSTYLGASTPTVTAGLRSRLGLPGALAIAALIDYHGGYKLDDSNTDWRCQLTTCRAMQDPSAPLEQQAAAYAAFIYGVHAHVQDASFAKLRELGITWSVPQAWSRELGSTDAAISIIGRNLATWTRYRGLDPEISASGSGGLPRSDFAARPLPRQVVVRVDLGTSSSR